MAATKTVAIPTLILFTNLLFVKNIFSTPILQPVRLIEDYLLYIYDYLYYNVRKLNKQVNNSLTRFNQLSYSSRKQVLMNFPSSFPVVFVWFLIAIFIFRHHMRKDTKAQEKVSKAFWQKEESSLVVRKKNLAPEDFLHPSLTEADLKDEDFYKDLGLSELYRQDLYLKELLKAKMVNFQHTTNTDLRLTYGTAMIKVIEAYEEDWNAYINTLFLMGKKLITTKAHRYGALLLEEGVSIGTDNRAHYLLLAKYYKDQGNSKALEALIHKAMDLESLTKDALLSELNTLIQG